MSLLPQPNNPNQALNLRLQDFDLTGAPIKTADSALALVIQNTHRAEKFIMARLWMSEWRVAKALYEAPVKQTYWRDTFVPRASNSYPLVAQHVRAILDQALPALFPEVTPFAVEPECGTPRQVARAWEAILSYQLRQAGVKRQMRLVMKDAEVFGTGIGKFGWQTYERMRTLVKRKEQPLRIPAITPGGPDTIIHTKQSDELYEYDVSEVINEPFFKRVEINHILVSPDLRNPDIRDANYVVHREYKTLQEIAELRGYEGYEIPADKDLLLLAAPPTETADSSALESEGVAFPTQGHRALPRYIDANQDPSQHKLEVLEYWTKDRVIVVLQRKVVIRNERNPFGIIPFVSCYWDDIPGTFYAFGISRRIGGMQTHVQGLRNCRLDDIHLNLQNMWKCKKGSNIAAQPIKAYPGAVFKIDDVDNLVPIEKQPVLSEAYKEEEVLVADAEKTSGANELLVQGASPGGVRSTGMRTGTGAAAVAGASSSRVQGFVNVCADQMLVPLLYSFLKMDRLWLDPATMRKLVSPALWKALEQSHDGDLLIDTYNESDIEFKMLAGSNIAARARMAQQLPLLMEFITTPAAQAALSADRMKLNWIELFRRMEQSTGWDSPEDLVIPQTQQDIQNAQQGNPKVLDANATRQRLQQMHQNASALSAQDHQQKMQQIDQQGLANTGQQILTKAVERSAVKAETPELAGTFGEE